MSPQSASLLSEYNTWMNRQVYAAARKLPPAELSKDRGAFFGSIIGTLNHVCVGDTIWLHRMAAHPAGRVALADLSPFPLPSSLREVLDHDLEALWRRRQSLDALIQRFVRELDAPALSGPVAYVKAGAPQRRSLGSILLHFFNHQTHHRGQVSTLLFQAGVDVGVTDLIALVPNGDGHEPRAG